MVDKLTFLSIFMGNVSCELVYVLLILSILSSNIGCLIGKKKKKTDLGWFIV
jgi:hypothetical protein